MQLNRLLALGGFAGTALARALPSNFSSFDSAVHTAGFYDPNNLASDSLWGRYQRKGAHYQCLFTADDRGAGRLVEDTRTPPSAQSIWKGSMSSEYQSCRCSSSSLTHLTAERRTWNWHENYFDDDNCNVEQLHLKFAFDELRIDTMCVEDGGHNEGWSLGHYDDKRMDPAEENPFAFFLEPIQQIYEAEGKIYKVRIHA